MYNVLLMFNIILLFIYRKSKNSTKKCIGHPKTLSGPLYKTFLAALLFKKRSTYQLVL